MNDLVWVDISEKLPSEGDIVVFRMKDDDDLGGDYCLVTFNDYFRAVCEGKEYDPHFYYDEWLLLESKNG